MRPKPTAAQRLGAEPADSITIYSRTDGGVTEHQLHGGLTKREHFAGLAMQGLLAQETQDANFGHVSKLAAVAVSQADALLVELAK